MQCKALRRKAGPNVVRELEGCGTGARGVRWRDGEGSAARPINEGEGGILRGVEEEEAATNDNVNCDDEARVPQAETHNTNRNIIILLTTPQEATKGVREAMAQSRWPMAYLKISLDGRIEQLLWNRTAAAVGLEGVNVVMRHVPKEARQGVELESNDTESDQDGDNDDVVLKRPNVMEQEIVMTFQDDVWEWPLDGANTVAAE